MLNNDNGIILIIREALNLERHHLIKRKNHFMLFTDLCFFFLFFSFFTSASIARRLLLIQFCSSLFRNNPPRKS